MKDKKNSHGAVGKSFVNNTFVSRALHLAQLGLTAGLPESLMFTHARILFLVSLLL